jgi:transcriptional regulator with XRE-family HTH domain
MTVPRNTSQEQMPTASRPDDDLEIRPGMRRFRPRRTSVTEGGSVYGTLVANERAKLGLTQSELAARIRTSPSTISRIEQGHPPSARIREQLAIALNSPPQSPLRRAVSGISPHRPRRRPRVSLSSRWFWGGLAGVNILIALILGGRLSGGDTTSASTLPPSAVAVSDVRGAAATIHKARVEAQKAAAAEARRAAELKREREAAAAAAAAAAAKKAAAKAAPESTPTEPQPVAAPVTPAPAPAPSGGGGGGGGGSSSGPAPGLQHGIGPDGG